MKALRASVGIALLALGSAAHTNADTKIAEVLRPTPIAANGGTQLWSTYDPAKQRYALTGRTVARGIFTVPVAPRSVPFDADLRAREGELAVFYSRCKTEPKLNLLGLPRWATGRGCDLYAFDLNSGEERRIRPASTRGASEFLPAVWSNGIAFFRVYERRNGYRGKLPHLYFTVMRDSLGPPRIPARRSQRPRRLPVGTSRLCSVIGKPKRRECHQVGEATPNSLDLFRRRVSFVWEYQGFGEGSTHEVVLATLGGRRTLLERGTSGISLNIFLSPTGSRDRWVYYAQTCGGDPSPCGRRQRYHRYRPNGERQEARAPSFLLSFAHDPFAPRNGESFYVRAPANFIASPGNACQGEVVTPAQTCQVMQASRIGFGESKRRRPR